MAIRCRCCPQVCKISGLIINNEESRLQDHYAGRNYKCGQRGAAPRLSLPSKQG